MNSSIISLLIEGLTKTAMHIAISAVLGTIFVLPITTNVSPFFVLGVGYVLTMLISMLYSVYRKYKMLQMLSEIVSNLGLQAEEKDDDGKVDK